VNWLIMGSPTYFAHSNYSNAAEVALGTFNTQSGAAAAAHSVVLSLLYAASYTRLFLPFVVGLGAVLAVALLRRDSRAPMFLGAAIAVPLLQIVLTYIHQTAGWDRFYIYYIPFGIVLLAVAAVSVSRARPLALAAVVALSVAGGYGTFTTLQNKYWATWYDYSEVQSAIHGTVDHAYANMAPVINYLNAHPRDHVLSETFDMEMVMLRVKNSRQLITNSDRAFLKDLEAPVGRVGYILLPSVNARNAQQSKIAKLFPTFWYGRPVDWAKLVKVFPGTGMRLYKVLSDPPLIRNV
jgi:hypothetical protein